MSHLSIYVHIHTYIYVSQTYTYTYIYVSQTYWEDEEKIPSRQARTSMEKNQKVYTQTLLLFQSAPVLDTEVFPVLVEKSRAILVAFMLSNIRRKD